MCFYKKTTTTTTKQCENTTSWNIHVLGVKNTYFSVSLFLAFISVTSIKLPASKDYYVLCASFIEVYV